MTTTILHSEFSEHDFTSNCCGARPLEETLEKCLLDGEYVYVGRCNECKDGCEFFDITELKNRSIWRDAWNYLKGLFS